MTFSGLTIHFTVQNVITAVTSIVTIASGICALTPTPKPGSFWGKIYGFIELAALTVGKAKQTGIPAVDEAVKLAQAVEAAKAKAGITTSSGPAVT